ncbi:EAL domain-containing protein [Aquabacterium sp.]|uniref:EAL domain-containing response regulator n=1 Tax=Aquabacterium sp. TaxID=1872578 RepID=UPI003784ABC4
MTPPVPTALSVLVVEDSPTQREHLVAMLQDMGLADVLQAAEGHEALRLLQSRAEPVFLVITDIAMPGMDGIELLGRVDAAGLAEHLIVASARDPRLLETVERLGSEQRATRLLGTLVKPVAREQLQPLLDDALKPRRAGQRPAAPGNAATAAAPDLPEIERALAAGEFVPYFQPKLSLRDVRLRGVEVLARWQHPTLGLVGPQRFIPRIEGTPLMARFTLAIVEQSLRQMQQWSRSLPNLSVSLNLSADDLADAGFIERLTALVAAQGIAPAAVTWEVTETSLMSTRSLANLARLSLKGFGLAMDDYGIGYSSMQTLSRCPFTELKIDRSFVHGASERANRRAILLSALDIGRRLGITTVAEGVETAADWRLLRLLGCELAQGYLLARPMPGGDLLGWFTSQRGRLRDLAGPHDGAALGTVC